MAKPWITHPYDIGYLHVLDFALHCVVQSRVLAFRPTPADLPPSPSRDLDREEYNSGDHYA